MVRVVTKHLIKNLIASGLSESISKEIIRSIKNYPLIHNYQRATFPQTSINKDIETANLLTQIAVNKSELKVELSDIRAEIAGLITEIYRIKAELKEEIAGLRTEIYAFKAELKEDIANLRAEMKSEILTLIKWMVGSQIGLAAVIISALGVFKYFG